ncbi:hypothetical protein OKW31_002089 [Paraburkholderia atlantica]
MTRDHDHLDAGARIEIFEQIDPAAIGQLQVGEYDVRHLPDQLNTRFAQIARGGGGQPVFPDDGGKRLAGTCVVIDNQYMWHRVWKACKRGSENMRNIPMGMPLVRVGCMTRIRRESRSADHLMKNCNNSGEIPADYCVIVVYLPIIRVYRIHLTIPSRRRPPIWLHRRPPSDSSAAR